MERKVIFALVIDGIAQFADVRQILPTKYNVLLVQLSLVIYTEDCEDNLTAVTRFLEPIGIVPEIWESF